MERSAVIIALLGSGTYNPTLVRPVMENYANDIYVSNDRDRPSVIYAYENSRVFKAGIDAPTAITGEKSNTGSPNGTVPFTSYHRYRYANKNKLGPGLVPYVSNPSPEATITTDAGNGRTRIYAYASPDPKVTHIAQEVSYDGENWFFLRYIPNVEAYYYTAIDAFTSGTPIVWSDEGHDVPPADGRITLAHKNRLFKTGYVVESGGSASLSATGDITPALTRLPINHYWSLAMSGRYFRLNGKPNSAIIESVQVPTGTTLSSGYGYTATNQSYTIAPADPNVVYFTETLLPESWNLAENSFRILVNTNDAPKAMASYFDDIIFYGGHSMEGLKFEIRPDDGTIFRIDNTRGAINHECIVKVDTAIYALDYLGIHRYRGGVPEHISSPIDEILAGRANGWDGLNLQNAENTFFALHNPDLREITWYVTLNRANESSDMNKAVVYRYDNDTWAIYEHAYQFRAGALLPNVQGTLTPILAASGGGIFAVGDYSTDGVPESANASGICAPNCTSSLIRQSGVTLYTTGDGMSGCAIVVPGYGSGIVKSNTSSSTGTMTLLNALPGGAPAAGTAFYLAPIETKLMTRAVAVRSPADKSIMTYLEMLHEPPTDDGIQKIKVKVRLDYSASYTNFASSAKTLLPGVEVLAGALDTAVIDLSLTGYHSAGYIRIPMPSVAFHVAEVEVISDLPRASFKLNSLTIRGHSGELIEF